jgi:hypothetical protein
LGVAAWLRIEVGRLGCVQRSTLIGQITEMGITFRLVALDVVLRRGVNRRVWRPTVGWPKGPIGAAGHREKNQGGKEKSGQ